MTPDDVFLDIGCSFGTETLYAAKRAGGPRRVISLDGGLTECFLLAQNIHLNELEHVEIFAMAVGDRSGPIEFATPSNSFGVEGQPQFWDIRYHIQQTRIDDLLKESPTFVKIDVDGGEFEVLTGMGAFLRDERLKTVLVEVGESTRSKVVELLEAAGLELTGDYPLGGGYGDLIFDRRAPVEHKGPNRGR
jgi:FkbM family methyltransferase